MSNKVTDKDCINAINNAFPDNKKQFKVGIYGIDIYLPEYNLVIDSKRRAKDPEFNFQRQKFLKQKLNNCLFLKFDTEDENFNVFKLIRDISNLINDSEIRSLKLENKLLKLENQLKK